MENIQESELIFDRRYTLDAIYIPNVFYDLFSISEGFSDIVFAIGEIPVVTVGDLWNNSHKPFWEKGI